MGLVYIKQWQSAKKDIFEHDAEPKTGFYVRNPVRKMRWIYKTRIIRLLSNYLHFFNVKCLVIIRNNLTFADDGNCLNSNHLCPEDTLFTVMGLVSVIRTVFSLYSFDPNIAWIGPIFTDWWFSDWLCRWRCGRAAQDRRASSARRYAPCRRWSPSAACRSRVPVSPMNDEIYRI